MPCFHPLQGFVSRTVNPSGKRSIVFNINEGFSDRPQTVPCGRCTGCRLTKSGEWAVRGSHEASLYRDNCFITLTYNDTHLPDDMCVDVRVFQLFMKRLRKRFGDGIRVMYAGEYGDQFRRPHYHAIIFNFDFPDKYPWRKSPTGHTLYRSDSLEELWNYQGHCEIGTVSFDSIAYVARYIMKKVNGDMADEHYKWLNPVTGELVHQVPEFMHTSRRPGIAKQWFDKFYRDVYPDDFCVIGGKKMKVPRFYDSQFELTYPSDYANVKRTRLLNSSKRSDDNTPDRLYVREQVQLARISKLHRDLI